LEEALQHDQFLGCFVAIATKKEGKEVERK
jgi:hypothetical protein